MRRGKKENVKRIAKDRDDSEKVATERAIPIVGRQKPRSVEHVTTYVGGSS